MTIRNYWNLRAFGFFLCLILAACKGGDNNSVNSDAVGSIRGDIYLSNTSEPVYGARVSIGDQSGSFPYNTYVFENVPAGNAIVSVERSGYNSYNAVVEIVPDRVVYHNINLVPNVYLVLRGEVYDATDPVQRPPLEGARITVSNNTYNKVDFTDSLGQFRIERLPPWVLFSIIAEKAGYGSYSNEFMAGSDPSDSLPPWTIYLYPAQ